MKSRFSRPTTCGRYPEEINEAAVKKIVSALVGKFGKKIVVSHDARLNSPALSPMC